MKSWNFACTVVFWSSNQPIKTFRPKGSFSPFWPFLTKFEKKIEKNFVYDVQVQKSAISRPKSRQFPTVLETLGNYLLKSRISAWYLKRWAFGEFLKIEKSKNRKCQFSQKSEDKNTRFLGNKKWRRAEILHAHFFSGFLTIQWRNLG